MCAYAGIKSPTRMKKIFERPYYLVTSFMGTFSIKNSYLTAFEGFKNISNADRQIILIIS